MNLNISFSEPVSRLGLKTVVDSLKLGDVVTQAQSPSTNGSLDEDVSDPGVTALTLNGFTESDTVLSTLNAIAEAYPDSVRVISAKL